MRNVIKFVQLDRNRILGEQQLVSAYAGILTGDKIITPNNLLDMIIEQATPGGEWQVYLNKDLAALYGIRVDNDGKVTDEHEIIFNYAWNNDQLLAPTNDSNISRRDAANEIALSVWKDEGGCTDAIATDSINLLASFLRLIVNGNYSEEDEASVVGVLQSFVLRS